MGLREGGRGLRPGLRLLRHPVFRGPQRSRTVDAVLAEVDAAAAAQEIVLVAQDLAGYGRDQGVGRAAPRPARRGGGRAGRPGPAALPVPVRPHRRLDRRDAAPPACPYFDLSLQHVVRARCCGACGAGATATGSSPASTTSARGARRRVPLELHRRLPGRDRGATTTQLLAFVDDGPARLVRLLRLLRARRAPTPPTSTAPWPPELMAERLRRAARAPGPHHRRSGATTSSASAVEVLVDAPGVGPQPPRGARDRRRRPRARRPRGRVVRAPWRSPAPLGPDLRGASRCVAAVGARLSRWPRSSARRRCATPANARHRRPRLVLTPPLLALIARRAARRGSAFGALDRPRRSPTASTASSPAATAPPARARSSTRWPTRSSCSARMVVPRRRRARSGGSRSRSSPSASWASARFRIVLRPPRPGRPGHAGWPRSRPSCRQLAVGFALLPATAPTTSWLADVVLLGRRRAHRGHRRAVPPGRQPRRHRPPAAGSGRAACAVRSWRSAPSCCSARSSTPTRRGSASSSRSPASTRLYQTKVGDNPDRIVAALRDALERGRRRDRLRRPRARPRTTSPAT